MKDYALHFVKTKAEYMGTEHSIVRFFDLSRLCIPSVVTPVSRRRDSSSLFL